jgi:acyl-coenzyme A synthetase/AMP-(fatty) acid ligase
MVPVDLLSLRAHMAASGTSRDASLRDAVLAVAFGDIISGTVLSGRRRELQGKSVLIATKAQLVSALALIDLDGIASRLVICPLDFTPDRLASVIEQAEVDAIVCDEGTQDSGANLPRYLCSPLAQENDNESAPRQRTEWILPTSGTTGSPKLVAHRLEGLLGTIAKAPLCEPPIVWATFYDIRRYGGLQIFLRAVAGNSTLVLSDAEEPLADYLLRCRAADVTHMSGTPSHWRRLLMTPHANILSLEYVRLSGEVADRAILDSLRDAYPDARIEHAYASTEAGVAFEVSDGLEGFPASFVDAGGEVELRVEDGSLRVRSSRTAVRYVGHDTIRLFDENGFVDTDDMVELHGDRYFFKGRRAGVINIGGMKVHPEEVESVINLHSAVRMSLVTARRNPIMGNIIVARVVLKGSAEEMELGARLAALRNEILAACRERLERYKVPATIDFVDSLDVMGSGKLARHHA